MSDSPSTPPPRGASTLASLVPQRSAGLKLILVCALALLMSIPALFVYGVVYERATRAEQAVADVSQRSGGAQSVLGPVLTVPYSRAPNPKKPDDIIYGLAVAYAEDGAATADIHVEERKRGIYVVPVFDAKIDFAATFNPADLRAAIPKDATPLWADARVFLGVSDTRGVKEAITATVNGRPIPLEPAVRRSTSADGYNPVPEAGVNLAAGRISGLETSETPIQIAAALRLTGADRLSFGPFARDTRVSMTSDWADPSFVGGVLPDRRVVGGPDAPGFEAEWRVPYLARGIPGAGRNLSLYEVTNWNNRDMAVRFINTASPYQSVQRALKYGVMFIGFVFLAYFLFEIASRLRAHPAQYVLVGLAQAIFYLLLLAFAERFGFDIAFAAAAGMIVCLTALYAVSVFRSLGYGLKAFGVLSALYGLMYLLMRAEDQALLAGALASFAAIALTMWMTRRVDWYGGHAVAA